MFNEPIKNIKPFVCAEPGATYILVQHTEQVPPHIALVSEEKYYSSSVSGVKFEVEVESVLKNIRAKNIPSLLIQIEPVKFSEDALSQIFIAYGPLDSEEKSCLFPIIELLNRSYKVILTSEFIFELIRELGSLEKVLAVYELNMDHIVNNHQYALPFYSRDEIRFCIRKLKERQLT